MNSLVAVHQLDDTQVRGDTCEHIRIVATEMLLVHQEVDQLFQCDLGGFVQILVEANGNVIRWCLGSRPMDLHVLGYRSDLHYHIQRLMRSNVHIVAGFSLRVESLGTDGDLIVAR